MHLPKHEYRHRLCTVIASLWFSMDHHQTSLMPFWLLTDDMYITYVWPPDGADHSSYPLGSAFQSSPSCCTRSSLTLLRHASSLASLSSTSSSSSYALLFRYIYKLFIPNVLMPQTYLYINLSRKSHARQFSQKRVRRIPPNSHIDLVTVT